ncbi:hypothetical protein FH5_00920 [Priestia endophytica]|nr:hypothetical protein FH5_00920 [Priestia endophytica]
MPEILRFGSSLSPLYTLFIIYMGRVVKTEVNPIKKAVKTSLNRFFALSSEYFCSFV